MTKQETFKRVLRDYKKAIGEEAKASRTVLKLKKQLQKVCLHDQILDGNLYLDSIKTFIYECRTCGLQERAPLVSPPGSLEMKFHNNKTKKEHCFMCEGFAKWVRKTQFAGDHFFCDGHAREEEDFGKEIDGQFFWKKIK